MNYLLNFSKKLFTLKTKKSSQSSSGSNFKKSSSSKGSSSSKRYSSPKGSSSSKRYSSPKGSSSSQNSSSSNGSSSSKRSRLSSSSSSSSSKKSSAPPQDIWVNLPLSNEEIELEFPVPLPDVVTFSDKIAEKMSRTFKLHTKLEPFRGS